MAMIIGYVATLVSIAGVFAKVIMDYSKLKSKVDSLMPLMKDISDLKLSDATQQSILVTIQQRAEEDRESAKKNYDRFFNAQNEMASTLKEVTAALTQMDRSMESRLTRLEAKIDSITTIKVGN